ncbi:MAG: poly-gamma-glutamate synthase PgsB [Candidatus Aminicenantes bacterium]|nr:poly-gamma-glutamate synthase PgsB [Candidatus Aminicenantes bacterium]
MNWILLFSLLVLLTFLGLESLIHRSRLKKIPHRVAVTGIRGKSSITRLIASGLREAGFKVMAKTTGSKPVLVYPNGREVEIKRRGRPSILEQKKLVKEAVNQRADFLVSEMMSIQPECLQAETRYLLRPEILVVSNIRPDHIESLGKTREEIARNLSATFPVGVQIFIPEEEIFSWMADEARRKDTEIVPVRKNSDYERLMDSLSYIEFEPNIRLAVAVLQHYGLSGDLIRQGLKKVNPDYGSLRIWKKSFEDSGRTFYFVNLFAANDPLSSVEAMVRVIRNMGWEDREKFGLLSFRSDRAERTKQWLDFLAKEWMEGKVFGGEAKEKLKLSGVALFGPGAKAAWRYLKKSKPGADEIVWLLKTSEPESCLREIITHFSFPASKHSDSVSGNELSSIQPEPVIFGLGNIVGFGQKMIDYLERTADAVKL